MDHPDTQQQAPLISNRDHEEDYDDGLDDAVGRASSLEAGKAPSPGLFMWLLTFSAGIGGLLFGCTQQLTHRAPTSCPSPLNPDPSSQRAPRLLANNRGTQQMTRA